MSHTDHTVGHRIKPRLARKAVRRARSSVETSSRPERKPPYVEQDPREPQTVNHRRSPYVSRLAKDRQHRHSLPEDTDNSKYVSESANCDSQPNTRVKTKHKHLGKGQSTKDVDLSSPSSYKETSPECEVVDMFDFSGTNADFQRSKSARAFAENAAAANSMDFRSRLRTPSSRSLESIRIKPRPTKSHLRRRRNLASHDPSHLQPKKYKDDPFSVAVDMLLSPAAKESKSLESETRNHEDSIGNAPPTDTSVQRTAHANNSATPREPARVKFREMSPGK